jgi:hypothetical protein
LRDDRYRAGLEVLARRILRARRLDKWVEDNWDRLAESDMIGEHVERVARLDGYVLKALYALSLTPATLRALGDLLPGDGDTVESIRLRAQVAEAAKNKEEPEEEPPASF